MEKIGSIRSWQFTELGFNSMPNLLLVLTTTSLRNELQNNRYKELVKFSIKFAVCYVLCQLFVFLIGLTIGKMELNISSFREHLSIISVLISIIISLNFASKIWFPKNQKGAYVRNIAYYEFLKSKIRLASILFASIVFVLHSIFELVAVQLGLQNEAKSFIRFLIQSAALGGVVYLFSSVLLPEIIKNNYDKEFKAGK